GIDLEAFKAGKSGDYFLSVQRAMPSKRLDLQLDVFEELPGENLKIVGQALYGTKYQQRIMKRVEKMNNVEWIGAASDAELKDLYAHCKAVIQTPMFEDLGAVPIEAMASGKPCIAVNEEGMQESIVHGVTGLLVDQPHKANFVRALKDFDSFGFKEKNCLERAKYFSEGEFFKRMDAAVKAAGF
ncbi:MAG TPA: glycosyltransferase, partial [archaeon]|nr:glycosyltransferase [archaeon]